MGNRQIHKKFSDEQVIAILENYLAKEISVKEAMAKLELKRSRFFNPASRYRDGSDDFTIKHKGNAGNRKISEDASSLVAVHERKEENVWAHILALKSVFLRYGCPFKYYPDQHAIFRYVKDRDKNRPWNNYTKFTNDIDPQWKQVLQNCGVGLTYALSPQAKGKIERPYRWLQDRIVRIAAKEKLTTVDELKIVLKELVNIYNTK